MKNLRLISPPEDIGDGIGFRLETRDGYPVLTADKKMIDQYSGKRMWKIGVSVSSGCGISCIYCFTRKFRHFRPLSKDEIVEQVEFVISQPGNSPSGFDEMKVCFKQMGDPLLNPENTYLAIRKLHERHANLCFVISTSGPNRNRSFFTRLNNLVNGGKNIRLQFSCHTTSDVERERLSPRLSMLTFAEIAEIVKEWNGGPVTLNFVTFADFSYDAKVIERLFPLKKVFLKLNYIDHHAGTQSLRDADESWIQKFETDLRAAGFQLAYRH